MVDRLGKGLPNLYLGTELPFRHFNAIFRRFHLTHLEKSECPEPLKHFWSGHAARHVSERYVKLDQDRDFRLMWAEKIGLGFELPGAKVGQLGQLLQFRKAV
jgi:hypothetical protein